MVVIVERRAWIQLVTAILTGGIAASIGTGCMTKQQAVAMRTGQGDALPILEIREGLAERLALMDEYRLHDEMRKHMTRHPHVTIEELPPEEAPPETESEPPSPAP